MTEHRAEVVVLGWVPAVRTWPANSAEAGLDVVASRSNSSAGMPYWGCVPSKMMIRPQTQSREGRRIPQLAGTVRFAPTSPVAQRIRDEATDNWDDQVAADRFIGKGGRLVRGQGRLVHVTPSRSATTRITHREPWSSPLAPTPRSRRSTGWPERRSGPTVKRSRPPKYPTR